MIDFNWNSLVQAFNNPAVLGLTGVAVGGWILSMVKQAPNKIKERISKLFSTSNTVDKSMQPTLFALLVAQLTAMKPIWEPRHSFLRYEDEQITDEVGMEKRWYWYGGKLFSVYREFKDSKATTMGVSNEFLNIEVFMGKVKDIKTFILEAAQRAKKNGTMTQVRIHTGWWTEYTSRLIRSQETLFLPSDQKGRVLTDVSLWMKSKALYQGKGLVWKRGYLLHGRPGTGKSTLAFVIAGMLRRDVAMVSLTSFKSDADFLYALSNINSDCVLLLEDVDASQATTESREASPAIGEEGEPGQPAVAKQAPGGVSLSTLFNFLDGAFSRDGQVVIMTTNHVDKLDPALIRPGRVDLMELVDLLDPAEAQLLAEFYLGPTATAKLRSYGVLWPLAEAVSGAQVQEWVLGVLREELSAGAVE